MKFRFVVRSAVIQVRIHQNEYVARYGYNFPVHGSRPTSVEGGYIQYVLIYHICDIYSYIYIRPYRLTAAILSICACVLCLRLFSLNT